MKKVWDVKAEFIKIWETGVILFAVMGFWGMIYPDLCFTKDVCVSVYGNIDDKDMFSQICEADSGQIIVKSRLAEFFSDKDGRKQTKERKIKEDAPAVQAAETVKEISRKESKGKKNAVDK